jgi:polyhydroxybutyrate depolymerase
MTKTVVLAFAGALFAADVSAQRADVMTWKVAEENREAWVYAPTVKSPTGKSPLVFSFHGHGDSVQNFQRTALHRAFPEAIVVYPEGSSLRLDGLSGWQSEEGQDHNRDLQFLDAMLATLREKFAVDESRVYATGFSNGGGFTYLLWAARPDVFAAFAPVSTRIRPSVRPAVPRPILHVGGRRDPTVLFRDQQESIDVARHANHASDEGASCGTGCTEYGAASDAPVIAWIHSGGHEYPAGTADGIAKFFRDHPKKPAAAKR